MLHLHQNDCRARQGASHCGEASKWEASSCVLGRASQKMGWDIGARAFMLYKPQGVDVDESSGIGRLIISLDIHTAKGRAGREEEK